MARLISRPLVTFISGAAACLALLNASAHEHDHEHDAPPPPAERHTVVSDEELARQLKAETERKTPLGAKPELPPLPAGVEALSFADFYKMPVGPRGLEPTSRLLALDKKKVRILGYMGAIRLANKRQFIFATVPLQPQPEEYGDADEIPCTHVLVTAPGDANVEVPLTPGPMLLTGTLSVGLPAPDGSASFVRMQLDAPLPAASPAK
ncbi:MAG: hypothetical protein QM755_12745 [Luteolibacter sp.]